MNKAQILKIRRILKHYLKKRGSDFSKLSTYSACPDQVKNKHLFLLVFVLPSLSTVAHCEDLTNECFLKEERCGGQQSRINRGPGRREESPPALTSKWHSARNRPTCCGEAAGSMTRAKSKIAVLGQTQQAQCCRKGLGRGPESCGQVRSTFKNIKG